MTKFCQGKDDQFQYNFDEVSLTKKVKNTLAVKIAYYDSGGEKVPILNDHEERVVFMRCSINGLFCCNHVHGINSPHWKASNKVGRGTKAHLIQGRI